VLTTVYLDDEPTIMTDKIEDVAAERNLSPKAEAFKTMCPERIPKFALSRGHLPPQ
jgi:hypothetical protein